MGSTRMTSLASLFFIGALLQVVFAVDHRVGGDFGWNLPPTPTFFSEWASNNNFFVGDWLSKYTSTLFLIIYMFHMFLHWNKCYFCVVFNSSANETHNYARLESQADFNGCIKPGLVFETVISIGFTRPGREYFMCTIGNHCNLGMKFAVDVLPKPGIMPPNAAVKVGALQLPTLLFATIMPSFFFFNWDIYFDNILLLLFFIFKE